MDKHAIGYDHNLYLTGRYNAVTRYGYSPKEVLRFEKETFYPIVYHDELQRICEVTHEGKFNRISHNDHENDLFLVPKTTIKYRAICPAIEQFQLKYADSISEVFKSFPYPDKDYIVAIEKITFTEGKLPTVEVIDPACKSF